MKPRVPRYFTHYWTNRTWERNRLANTSLEHTAGNLFRQADVRVGDYVYIVTVIQGRLFVLGKLRVGKVGNQDEAAIELGEEPSQLWNASDHIVASASTPSNYDRYLSLREARRLRFMTAAGPRPLAFKSRAQIDQQTLRGVRQLNRESALILDHVVGELLAAQPGCLPEEYYLEGATKSITINAYERDRRARARCLEHYGYDCSVCGFNFANVYGDIGNGYINVHHIKPLSEIGEEYELDPIGDLRPVCPNCHAMIHTKAPPYSIEEVAEYYGPAQGSSAQPDHLLRSLGSRPSIGSAYRSQL